MLTRSFIRSTATVAPSIRGYLSVHTGRDLPQILALRGVQMLLMLAVVFLTHRGLSSAGFLVFNAVLFSMGLAAACSTPSLRALWRTGSWEVAQKAAVVNISISAVFVMGVVFINQSLIEDGSGPRVFIVALCAILYCSAKAIERISFAYSFMLQEYYTAFFVVFLFVAGELFFIVITPSPHDIGWRLAMPAVAFLSISIWRVRRYIKIAPVETIFRSGRRLSAFFRSEYLSWVGLLGIVYTMLFVVACMIERIYPSFVSQSELMVLTNDMFKDYLLILSYGLAFQSLLAVITDWVRSRIIIEGEIQVSAPKNIISGVIIVVLTSVIACFIGYPILHMMKIIPDWVGLALWNLVVIRFSVQTLLFLFHLDLVLSGKLARAVISWVVIVLGQVLLISTLLVGENFEQYLRYVVVLVTAVCIVEGFLLARRLQAVRESYVMQ